VARCGVNPTRCLVADGGPVNGFGTIWGEEALHQTVKRTAEKERVGEGLVRRCVTEVVGKMLEKRRLSLPRS